MSFFERQEAEASERTKWLDSLVAGQEVSLAHDAEVGKVVRRTATQIIIEVRSSERRFNAKTGCQIGGASFSRYTRIVPLTDQLRAEARAKRNRHRFGSITYRSTSLTDAQIAAMLDAYDQLEASKPEGGVA